MRQLRRFWRQLTPWTVSKKSRFWDRLLNVNISVTVGQIFIEIGTFIENRDIHAVKL